jgi:hypothetical protein
MRREKKPGYLVCVVPGEFSCNPADKKEKFTGGVYVQCVQVVNSIYLFLEAGVCLHKPHGLYSYHLDPGLCDGDRDPARGLVYGEHGVVGGDTGLFPDGFGDLLFFAFCQDSSYRIKFSIEV